MEKIENQVIEFEGGGVLRLEVLDDGVGLLFQAPHLGEQFRITSMNVVLTPEEAKDIFVWLNKALVVFGGNNV